VQASLDAAGADRSAAVNNRIDYIEDIAPIDVSNLPVLPVGEYVTFDLLSDDTDRPFVRLIPFKPFLENALKVGGPVTRRSDAARIASGLDVVTGLAPSLTRLGKSNGWVGAECQAAKPTPHPVEINEGLSAPVGHPQG
jgi:hypothetical protein